MSKYEYKPTTWIGGKTIGTADVMNNIEDGIVKAHERLDNIGDIMCITPEQFGAVGDGTTNDINAFNAMFEYMTTNAPSINVGETSIKDFGKYEILFTGKYAVSNAVTMPDCYNLTLNGLYITATNTFSGEFLIVLPGICRNVNFSNCIFDGNEYKASCLLFDELCSDINTKITNCNFRRFKTYGIKNIGTGHEMLINNCKINQYDYGSEGYPSGAIGIYIGEETHDHQITNCVICYCSDSLFTNHGGSVFVNNTHFYGIKVCVPGLYTFFNGCYFDWTYLELNGYNSVKNCFFLAGDSGYFIKLTGTADNMWTYEASEIIGNRFSGNGQSISESIVADNFELHSAFMNIYDNTFYDAPPVCAKATHVINPSPFAPIWTGTQSEYDALQWKDEHTLYLIRGE